MITPSELKVGDIVSFASANTLVDIGLICPAKLSNKGACVFCGPGFYHRCVKFHILWVPIIEPLYSHIYNDIVDVLFDAYDIEKITLNDVAKLRLNNKLSSKEYEQFLKHVKRYANG